MNISDQPIYSAMFDIVDLFKYMFGFLDSIYVVESEIATVSFADFMIGIVITSLFIGFIVRALGSGDSIGIGSWASFAGEKIRASNAPPPAPPKPRIHLHYKAGNWGGKKSDT